MTYGKFAYLYDELMQEVPYSSWVDIVKNKAEKYGVKGKNLLDLACGTGELSVRFLEAGYHVTGVDLSEDMLTVAQNKIENNGYKMELFEQNMVELDLMNRFDIIGIFCDSLNYLMTEEEVVQTFENVYEHLEDGGLFIFDVHSIYKIMQIFMNQTFTYDEERICYIWNCYQGEYPNSIEHELTFFVEDETTGMYHRYDEFHTQRTFPIDVYTSWIEKSGFELLEVISDFEDISPQNESERIFFVLRKK